MTTLEQVIAHESAHVAALLSMGVSVQSVDVIDRGEQKGFVHHDSTDAVTEATHILCAWLAEPGLPAWPLDASRSVDEARFVELAQRLDWDHHDYQTLVGRAPELMGSATFRKTLAAVSSALRTAHMLEEALRRLLKPEHKSASTDVARTTALALVKAIEDRLQDEEPIKRWLTPG
jgi:hypothetical protein